MIVVAVIITADRPVRGLTTLALHLALYRIALHECRGTEVTAAGLSFALT